MLFWAILSAAVVLLIADFLPRLVHCRYQLEAITRVAYERANGAACTYERSLYVGVMSPSCVDYETQLQYAWQISYQTQCTLNSYHFLRSWWFFATVLGLLAYGFRVYLNRNPQPTFNVVQLPRGFSILPQRQLK